MRFTKSAVAAVAAATVLAGVTTTALAGTGKVSADSMVGVPKTMTGPLGATRGINGGGLAWSIGAAEASLKTGGKLEIEFDNLVFADGPNIGKNTLPTMNAVVSCITASNEVVNVATGPFPVTTATALDPGGDGSIEAKLAIPSPCFAPIIFITNAAGTGWFAVDGV